MSRCRALIFDVDGTLADTEEAHRRAFNQAFASFGLEWVWDPPLYADLLRVTGGKERLASYLSRLSLPQAQRRRLNDLIPRIHERKTQLYRDLVASGGLSPRPGVRKLMLQAREAGIRLAIASTTTLGNIEPLLTSILGRETPGWFAAIAAGDSVINKKPAPDIYNVALKTLNLDASRAIAIEDSAIGVQSARAAGLFTIATPGSWT